MDRTASKKRSVLATCGYFAWFMILVHFLVIATNDESSNAAESLGFHLGVGACLLVLLGIPYIIERFRAKRRDDSVSWFLVMMWTTIIALLLAVGGFYGRLYMATQAPSSQATVTNDLASPKTSATQSIQATTQQIEPNETDNWWWEEGYLVEPDAGSPTWLLVGEWRCTQRPSTQFTRLILAKDGSISATNEGSSVLIKDPWLRWYVPNQNRGEQMYFVHIKVVSPSNIAMKYPSGNIDECVR